MAKFPSDIIYAEKLTGGDPNIVYSKEFEPIPRPNIEEIFGSPARKKRKQSVFRNVSSCRGRPRRLSGNNRRSTTTQQNTTTQQRKV